MAAAASVGLMRAPAREVPMPSPTPIGTHTLPYEINEWTAFSDRGVQLEKWKGDKLQQLELQESTTSKTASSPPSAATPSTSSPPSSAASAGSTYNVLWENERPVEMRWKSDKAMLADGTIVTRHPDVDLSLVYSRDLQLQTRITDLGDRVRLRGSLPPDRLVYHNTESGQVSVYSAPDHRLLRTLPGPAWPGVSACGHPAYERLAVTVFDGDTLDIYDLRSELRHTVQLGFEPLWANAVASVKDCIVIAEAYTCRMFVYNWHGERVGQVDGAGLGMEGMIAGIGAGHGDTLQVCTGKMKRFGSGRVMHVIHMQ